MKEEKMKSFLIFIEIINEWFNKGQGTSGDN